MKNHDLKNKKFIKLTFWNRLFGDVNFIKTFWKLLLPSFVWGFISSLVPLLFNLFTNLYFSNHQNANNNLYVSINYTYITMATVNYLSVVLVVSLFPAIGNFIGNQQYGNFKQTIRFGFIVGMVVSSLLMIFEQAFAKEFVSAIIYSNKAIGNQVNLSVNILRSMSFIGFSYVWIWIYIPSLSSMKNTKVLLYSSVLSLIYFLIVYLSYLTVLSKNYDLVDNFSVQLQAAYSIGGIYLSYFFIQPLIIYLYCLFAYQFKYAELKIAQVFNKKITEYNFFSLKTKPIIEKQVLFMKDFFLTKLLIIRVLKLSWGNILDQALFNIIGILHLVFGTNFGGYFSEGEGFNLINPQYSANAANDYYKLIIIVPSMITGLLYGIFNSFIIAPQYFVANKFGQKHKQEARRNMHYCMNWSYLIGLLLFVIIFIFAFFLNKITNTSTDPNAWYDIYLGNNIVAQVRYYQLWKDSQNIMLLFAFVAFLYSISTMGFYVVLNGASKLIVLADTLGSLIFVIITMALHYTHFSNMYAYYIIPNLDKLFKYIIYMLIIATNKSNNSIHDIPEKENLHIESKSEHVVEKPLL